MAGHRTNSAESKTRNTFPMFSFDHPGGSSESMLWAPALASGDDGSVTSSFRLPELSIGFDDHSPEYFQAEGLLAYENLGVDIHRRYSVAQLSWAETFDIHPALPLALDPNSRPAVETCKKGAANIHAPAGDATPPRTEADPPVQPPAPANETSAKMPDAADPSAPVRDKSWDPLILALLASSSAPVPRPARAHHQHGAACTHRHQSSAIRAAAALRGRPYSVVPHANEVTMPAIGAVGGFKRTRDAFQELRGTPPAALPSPLPFAAPITHLPSPRPTVTDFAGGALHRSPRMTPKTSSSAHHAWKRTDLAAQYASAIYSGAQLQETGQEGNVRAQGPPLGLTHRDSFARQGLRPLTARAPPTGGVLTFNPTAGGPPTPAQRPAANNAVRPAGSKTARQRAARRVAKGSPGLNAKKVPLQSAEPLSASALQKVQNNLVERIRAQEHYLKMVMQSSRASASTKHTSKL